ADGVLRSDTSPRAQARPAMGTSRERGRMLMCDPPRWPKWGRRRRVVTWTAAPRCTLDRVNYSSRSPAGKPGAAPRGERPLLRSLASWQYASHHPASAETARDVECFTRDPARVLRGEEDRSRCHVPGLADAPQRRLAFVMLAEITLGQPCGVDAFGLDHA